MPNLSRPVVSVVVLGLAVLVLVLILAAAYHGSGSGSVSRCGSDTALLRRVARDLAAPAVPQLQRDDDDVNNVINAGSHPGLLPLAGSLGRVVTDLQDHAPADADLTAARSALAACGA